MYSPVFPGPVCIRLESLVVFDIVAAKGAINWLLKYMRIQYNQDSIADCILRQATVVASLDSLSSRWRFVSTGPPRRDEDGGEGLRVHGQQRSAHCKLTAPVSKDALCAQTAWQARTLIKA
jgi:hypothetical protein